MNEEYIACSVCGIRKLQNIDNFAFRSDTKKWRTQCRTCRAANDRAKHKNKTTHITKRREERDELFAKGFKRCSKCRAIMTLDKFNIHPNGHGGLKPKCITCQKEDKKPTTKEQSYKWNKTRRMKKYGITSDYFDTMMVEQKSKCKICKVDLTERTAHIDHCHAEGHVRGLLCSQCNTGLGMFQDNRSILQEAIRYLD